MADASRPRRTLAGPTALLQGIGLHSGKAASLRVRPAPPGAGLIFCDTQTGQEIPALAANVTDTSRCTVLGQGGIRVQTVEHVLSALAGLGIDDARIETTGGELPIADGSATPFVSLLETAGITTQAEGHAEPLVIREPVLVAADDGASITCLPCASLRLTVVLDYPRHPYLGTLAATFDAATDDYAVQVAPARTYGFVSEMEWLLARGLALGASRENAVALGETEYETPLRFANELARHKLLDIIGDLALLGRPLQAHVLAFKPSHALNVRLASRLGQHAAAALKTA